MSVYFYLSIVTIIIGVLVSLFRLKTPVNPIVAFAGPWFIVLVYSVSLDRLPIASNKTYQIIFYGLLSFILGVFVLDIFQRKITVNVKKERVTELNKKIVYFLIFVSIIFYLKNLLFFYTRGVFGLDQIIAAIQSGNGPNNPVFLSDWIVLPSLYAIGASVISSWVLGDKDKKLLFTTVVMYLLAGLSTGSKTLMVLLLVFLLVAIMVTGEVKLNFKKSVAILLVVASIYLVFLVTANSRNQFSNDLTKYELGIPPRMFQIWSDKLEGTNLMGYGEASLAGLLQSIVPIAKRIAPFIDFSHFDTIYDWTISTDSTWVNPGTNIPANAYVSCFYFFYLDFRVIGVFTFSFITGAISAILYNLARKQNIGIYLSIYIVFFYQLLYSFIRSNFSIVGWALAFLYLYLFWKKGSKKKVVFKLL